MSVLGSPCLPSEVKMVLLGGTCQSLGLESHWAVNVPFCVQNALSSLSPLLPLAPPLPAVLIPRG